MPVNVKLDRTKIDERTWKFNLIVSGEIERVFYLASIKNGRMTLVNYEISQENGHDILSAFFYVNIMGHDLDQWIHFDLVTGEQAPNYINPRQRASRLPGQDKAEFERDRRETAKKLRLSLEKWGQER